MSVVFWKWVSILTGRATATIVASIAQTRLTIQRMAKDSLKRKSITVFLVISFEESFSGSFVASMVQDPEGIVDSISCG